MPILMPQPLPIEQKGWRVSGKTIAWLTAFFLLLAPEVIAGRWYWIGFWLSAAAMLGVWELISIWRTGYSLSHQWQTNHSRAELYCNLVCKYGVLTMLALHLVLQ